MAPNTKSPNIPLTKKPLLSSPLHSRKGGPRKEILIDNFYYDVTDWAKVHPGGRIIDFYTESGEDATIAFQQFHTRSSRKVGGILKSFKKRPANNFDNKLDAQTLERYRGLNEDFVNLHRQLEREGLFKPSPLHIIYRITELVVLITIGIILTNVEGSLLCNILGLTTTALFYGRCGFLMHDSGHRALTGNVKVDRFMEIFLYGFGHGLSGSWWSSHHNRHHAMPQRVQRDVDLETMPLVAFNTDIGQRSAQRHRFWIRYQALLFCTLDTMLVSYYWKLYLHPRYAIMKGKYGDLLAMASHYIFLYYFLGLWPFLICMWASSTYLFGTFTLSHTHLPVTSKSLHWVEYGLVHTMDVNPSWWCDWWMGHLNYQIEHHLFPSIPHFRLHRIRDRVKDLAEKYGIPYQCVSYGQAVKKTYNNLINVSKELQH